jgi:hypothetical protein
LYATPSPPVSKSSAWIVVSVAHGVRVVLYANCVAPNEHAQYYPFCAKKVPYMVTICYLITENNLGE